MRRAGFGSPPCATLHQHRHRMPLGPPSLCCCALIWKRCYQPPAEHWLLACSSMDRDEKVLGRFHPELPHTQCHPTSKRETEAIGQASIVITYHCCILDRHSSVSWRGPASYAVPMARCQKQSLQCTAHVSSRDLRRVHTSDLHGMSRLIIVAWHARIHGTSV